MGRSGTSGAGGSPAALSELAALTSGDVGVDREGRRGLLVHLARRWRSAAVMRGYLEEGTRFCDGHAVHRFGLPEPDGG